MLIMGKKAAKSPKTKPTEFLKAKSPKSSPKSVPIPPLTPGKKVDLNLLFSSQFTPIKVQRIILSCLSAIYLQKNRLVDRFLFQSSKSRQDFLDMLFSGPFS